MKKALLLAILCSSVVFAQESDTNAIKKGKPFDLGLFEGTAVGLYGSTSDTRIISAGVRIGKVLTGEHGPGFLRGKFEYAWELVPVYYVFQKVQNTYGAGFNPIIVKWNFTSPRRVVPFFEVITGTLFTQHRVPIYSNPVNFNSQGGIGLHMFHNEKHAATVELRYMHISNAGLQTPNPGVNSAYVYVGYHWFR